jgi:DNA-binding transcriptional ArsR family regulator
MNRSHPPLALTVQAAKAVGHPARLRLLSMLGAGPLCVCQMTAVLGLAPSTVSGHLLELRRGGLVTEEKHGKWVEYRLLTDGPYGRLIEETLALLADDPAVAADRVRIRQVTAVPVEVFCRTDSKVPKVRASARKRNAPGTTQGSPPIHKKGAGT